MLALLALVALASGFVNALAGGGAIFPALILAGLPAVDANASSTVVLFPIQFVSALAARPVLSAVFSQWRTEIAILAAISLAGGTVGAVFLLVVPPTIFAQLAPWLLLIATLFFG